MASQAERVSNLESLGASRYEVEIDPNSGGTHGTIIRLAGRDKRVLELGCATGHMSRVLRDRGCSVTAVELDPLAAEHAAQFCERVLVGDLDDLDLEEELRDDQFDVVVAADVLEHLKDPAAVLRSAKNLLHPDGYVIVSVPNVAHISVRLALLGGKFPYRPTGLLDRTHLRFFTRESIESLFEDAGIAIGRFHRTKVLPPEPEAFEVPYDPASVPASILDELSRDPEALTYQFVVLGYPLPRPALELIQQRMKHLAFELEGAQTQINELQGELQKTRNAHAGEIGEISRRNEQATSALEAEIRRADEAEGIAASLRGDIVRMQNEARELAGLLEKERGESAALRQLTADQKSRIEKLQANADALFAREKDLREMLFDAHEQLLRRDEEIASTLATTLTQAPAAAQPAAPTAGKYLQYQNLVRRVRELVQNAAPSGGNVLVVSKGDDDIINLPPCRGMHFPQAEGGVYAGHHPANSEAAIAQLDELRKSGAQFLLIPQTSLWWLDHYREFAEYLDRKFTRLVDEPDVCVLFHIEAGNRRSKSGNRAAVIPAAASKPFGVNVAGRIASEKGVGESVRAAIRGLNTAGIPIVLNDFPDEGSVNLETEFTDFVEDNPYAVNLIYENAETLPDFISFKADRYFLDHYNIAYWAWETPSFPRAWWDRFECLDEVWVGSSFVLDAVSRVSPVPVVKAPMALPDRLSLHPVSRQDFGIPASAFMFVFVFDYMSIAERKNPLAAIEAFRKAFRKRDDAILVLKSGHSAAYPNEARKIARACQGANIKIIDEVLPRADVNSLMHLADCYVSLHRSEGFGLTMAEAMSLGKPVIATAYSGNMDYMNPANSYLVKYKLVEIGAGCDPYVEGVWADPDVDHAAELMRHVFKNRSEAREIGRAARKSVLETLNARTAGAMMHERLLRIAGLRNIDVPPELGEGAQSGKRPRDEWYMKLTRRIADIVTSELPPDARVLVVSRGDDELLNLDGRSGSHFPQGPDGLYAGYNPPDSADAIGRLELLRRGGAEYLLFPQTAFWWLDHYTEFRSHLESSCRRIWSDHDCIIYDLKNKKKARREELSRAPGRRRKKAK